MTEGGIANWKKKEGDSFAVGDVLVEIIGDGSKAVPVGKAIAIFAEEGDEVNGSEVEKLVSEETSKPAPSSSSTGTPKSFRQSPPRSAIFASPAAKRIALEKGIPLGSIKGTGPKGRILESDLAAYLKAGGAPSASSASTSGTPYEDLPVSNMRRTIANRLGASKLNRLRALFNKAAEERAASSKAGGLKAPTKLSVNDFVIKASAWPVQMSLKNHHVDISVAVATPTGLITPIVTNNIKENFYRFESRNVGSVSQFTAIINTPQSCILAVGGAEKKLTIDEDPANLKGFKEVEVMKVTLSCDHRVVDGAVGARW
ncbi:hypothetical protein KEM48_008744 [Puccinia striiformis f. sp. tritici PST-130]|nr:hypothetical protein KEM48_008744 [Puccinia striiformis f. sp. tritici PST-130]